MPETTQDTCASAKDSPFFIKNLLNSDSKPSKPKPILASTKAGLDGSFSFSQVGEFNFPRFELPTQRFALPAYLERASAWWYPYTLSASAHLHRTEGKGSSSQSGFSVVVLLIDLLWFFINNSVLLLANVGACNFNEIQVSPSLEKVSWRYYKD